MVLLSTMEAAALLAVDEAGLADLMAAGRLRWYKIGGRRKIDLADVRRLDRGLPRPPKAPAKPARTGMSLRIRFAVLERDGFRCRYCGATPQDVQLVVDHVVSIADGGSSDMDNLVTACQPCNAGKGRHSLTVVA